MILAFTILFGCKEEDENMNGFNLSTDIEILYMDNLGENLLNSENENSFDFSNFRLFYLIGENISVVYDLNADLPRNMEIIENYDNTTLRLFTNNSFSNIVEETPEFDVVENIAYLELSETDTDTIKTHSLSKKLSHSTRSGGGCYFLVSKVWYNDVIVWERETGGVIEITKKTITDNQAND